MTDINILAIVIATLGAFVISGVWYALWSAKLSKLHKAYAQESKMGPAEIGIEILRSFTVATAVAFLLSGRAFDLASAFLMAVVLWLAFPVVLLAGSVIHEKVPVKLAAIHSGDWLIKLLFIVLLIALWR